MNITHDNNFRSDLHEFFRLCGIMEDGSKHSNIMSIEPTEDGCRVSIHSKPKNTLAILPRETTVIARWPGQYRSDAFIFTVGDWLDWKEEKAKQ